MAVPVYAIEPLSLAAAGWVSYVLGDPQAPDHPAARDGWADAARSGSLQAARAIFQQERSRGALTVSTGGER